MGEKRRRSVLFKVDLYSLQVPAESFLAAKYFSTTFSRRMVMVTTPGPSTCTSMISPCSGDFGQPARERGYLSSLDNASR